MEPRRTLSGSRPGAIIMTTLAGIAFFASLAFAYLSDDKQSLAILEGMGGGAFLTAIQFWLGSSVGSRRKDELLALSSPAPLEPTHLPPPPAVSK